MSNIEPQNSEVIDALKSAIVGRMVERVVYHQLPPAADDSDPEHQPSAEADTVELHLSDGSAIRLTWYQRGFTETIQLTEAPFDRDMQAFHSVDATRSDPWHQFTTAPVVGLRAGWTSNDQPVVWSLTLVNGSGAEVCVALGEIDMDGAVAYMPDSLVILSADEARVYNPSGSSPAFGDDL